MKKKTSKKTITKKDMLALHGIRVMASNLEQQMKELCRLAASMVGEELDESDYGRSADFVYGEETPREFIKAMGLKIKN